MAPGSASDAALSGGGDPLVQAADWAAGGKGVALATVVSTWGSSPRQPGSILAVAEDGAFLGSVSGGCIEAAVIAEALEVIAAGRPRLLDFGVTDERAWEVGLSCGGEMKVFVEAAPPLEDLKSLVADRPVARVTDLETGAQALVRHDTVAGNLDLDTETIAAVRRALADDRSISLPGTGTPLFATVFSLPMRLIVIGAVHIAQALVPMASLAGFEVIVIDPRQGFASDQRFPDVRIRRDWPDDALVALGLDARTALVTLTHDPKLDDPALKAALASDVFYVGALGSRRTHAKRLDRLQRLGVEDDELARIHAPVGLDLGGRKPAEIAVAILAQIVAARYAKETRR